MDAAAMKILACWVMAGLLVCAAGILEQMTEAEWTAQVIAGAVWLRAHETEPPPQPEMPQ